MKKLIIAAVAAVSLACITGCGGDFFESNRCVLRDRNHTFTRATVLYSGTNITYDVVAWRDYENSDVVQVWVKDRFSPNGTRVLLTHYSRIILENPAPKYMPKF